jgi:hypothetical protein
LHEEYCGKTASAIFVVERRVVVVVRETLHLMFGADADAPAHAVSRERRGYWQRQR